MQPKMYQSSKTDWICE